MLVVILITIFATLASPVLIRQWREMGRRGGRQAAIQVAQLYSEARMRALARGSAVTVRWNGTSGFTVLESIEGQAADTARANGNTSIANCAEQPGLGCVTTNWAADARVVQEYETVDAVSINGKTAAGADMTQMNVCFSPLGRSFVSFDGTSPTTPMVGAPTFEVRRMDKVDGVFTPAGQTRTVVIMPNGMARLAL
jgi:hypothetical protein